MGHLRPRVNPGRNITRADIITITVAMSWFTIGMLYFLNGFGPLRDVIVAAATYPVFDTTLGFCLLVTGVAFFQNVCFSMTSRARNRDNQLYRICTAVGSNGVWFLCIGLLDANSFSWYLGIFYIVGTVIGSEYGVLTSIKLEKWLGAAT